MFDKFAGSRRELLTAASALGGAMALGAGAAVAAPAAGRLALPAGGKIRVAALVDNGANMIDFAGPWEVFQDCGCELYTVATSKEPLTMTGGASLTAKYTFADAPIPHVLYMGAQGGRNPEKLEWIRHVHDKADIVMSGCTGAFLLAATGLLDGMTATTHHEFYESFAQKYPKVQLVKSVRFVEHEKIASAGGLTSGLDLALRVVERYQGRDTATKTAEYMEYRSTSWQV